MIEFIDTLETGVRWQACSIKIVPKINHYRLPEDFEYFLKWSNGFSLFGTEILGFENKEFDILKTVSREQNDTNNLMPSHIIPFSPMGNGDFYCFDLKEGLDGDGLCPIIYWQWNYSSPERYEKVNDSFIEWLKELIEHSLSDEEE
ncbi:MAG: SMI1/KNR4 family protein [Saprospiraceae bacterium]